MGRNLRIRLLVVIGLVALVPMVVVSLVTNILGFNAQRQAAFEQQQALADAAASQITFVFDSSISDLRELGSLRELVALGPAQQEVALSGLVAVSPLFRDVALLDSEGVVSVGIAREPGQTLDETGLLTAFMVPSSSGETYFGPVTFDPRSGVPSTIISTPIDSFAGPTDSSIVVADINLLPLSSLLAGVERNDSGQVYVLDAQGRVVAHPDPSIVRGRTSYDLTVEPNSTDFGIGLSGESAIIAVSALPFGNLDFLVVSEVPINTALQSAQNSIVASAVLTLIVLGLSMALGVVFAQQIVEPVQALAETADAIAAGDLSQRAAVTSNDEIGELAQTFNNMATQLELRVAEVAAQQRYLRQIIDTSPTLIYVKDHDGRFTLVNWAGADVYDATPEEMIGKRHSDFNTNEAELADYRATDGKVFETGRPLFIPEERVTTHAGDVRYVQTIKMPIEDDDGAINQILVVATDISARRAIEKEREELLEREREARREAQEANRSKDLFLATMSHELRTPLNAIIGFLGLMMFSEQLDEDNTHMAERALANADRLLALINTILDLSRISAGRLEITPVPTDLQDLARSIHADMGLRVVEKNLEFRVDIDDDLPTDTVHDEERLTQIATNLIGNAIKFTDEGYVAARFRREGETFVIEVEDTGVGIPISKQDIIFDTFSQVDSTSTRAHGGAGLGLSIVKRLTMMMDGQITVNSQVGQGTTFTVRVPIRLGQAEMEAP